MTKRVVYEETWPKGFSAGCHSTLLGVIEREAKSRGCNVTITVDEPEMRYCSVNRKSQVGFAYESRYGVKVVEFDSKEARDRYVEDHGSLSEFEYEVDK